MLRQILGAYLGAAPTALCFGYAHYGKPFLAMPEATHLSFNVSHSGDRALYAIAYGRRVGVDIERVRHDLEYTVILPGVFSAREQQILASLPAEQRRDAFFRGWVRKARGEGLSYAPDRVEVSMRPDEAATLTLPSEPDGAQWTIQSLNPGDGYVAAVVTEGTPTVLQLYII